MEELDRAVARVLETRLQEMDLVIPVAEGKLLSEIASHSVMLEQEYVDSHVRMRVRVPKFAVWKLERFKNGVPHANEPTETAKDANDPSSPLDGQS